MTKLRPGRIKNSGKFWVLSKIRKTFRKLYFRNKFLCLRNNSNCLRIDQTNDFEKRNSLHWGRWWIILDFKLSPSSECCMLSSGLFPGVWILYADVSEHCLFHLHRQVGAEWLVWEMLGYSYGKRFGSKIAYANRKEGDRVTLLHIGSGCFRTKPFPVWIPQHFSNQPFCTYLPMKDGTECSETSAYKIQTPGNYPEESIQQDGEFWLTHKLFFPDDASKYRPRQFAQL
jgi:hypothetical protein